MARQKISDTKARALAVKCGVDPEKVSSAWGRGSRDGIDFYLTDGTNVHSRTPKEIRIVALFAARRAKSLPRWPDVAPT
jgi:hypothetical protein